MTNVIDLGSEMGEMGSDRCPFCDQENDLVDIITRETTEGYGYTTTLYNCDDCDVQYGHPVPTDPSIHRIH
jgi:hypothetical protein